MLDTNKELLERQEEIELDMVNLGAERYRSHYDRSKSKDKWDETYPGITLTKMAVEPLADAIRGWKNEALAAGRGRRSRAAKRIEFMDPRGVAYVATKIILSRLYRSDTINNAAIRVGQAVMDEARFQHFAAEKPYLFDKVDETAKKNAADWKRRRKVLVYSMNKFEVEGFDHWTKNETMIVGLKLIELFTDVTGFVKIAKRPAKGRKGQELAITPTEELMEWIEGRNEIGEALRPTTLPCVVPPKPWDRMHQHVYHTDVMPSQALVQPRHDNRASFKDDPGTMGDVFDAVSAIQETPWAVNKDVLRVMDFMWTRGLPMPGLPQRENLPVPRYPEGGTEEQVANWKRAAREVHDTNAKSIGRRINIAMTLNTARRFENDAELYFPHYLDFRGRVYPSTGNLNPQGSDFSRSLLTFAHGKPLGDYDAVRWLAIHGANTYGEDKVSLDDRMQWVYEHEEEILWCAEDPIKFDWWHQADKPFSFLAFCFEWAGYKREGLAFRSSLPIALDGTCNGLQHYSAMLRDPVGGAAVNLRPSDTPADIYQTVADWVTDALQREAREGGEDPKHQLMAGTFLQLGIDRKVTKRPVMVLPYGGTFSSCREYVEEAVREKMGSDDPFGDDYRGAMIYLSKKVWEGMGVKIEAARLAMSWLQKVARVMAKHDLTVEWTTPSGFRAKQHYVDMEPRRVRTQLFGSVTTLSYQEQTDTLKESKQALAIAPNFVHSLDASAMVLTILKGLGDNITDFAMIHDSYGTLAADTQRFSVLIREAFVEMYERHDVLEDFRNDVLAMLPEEAHGDVPPTPAKGSLDIREVLRSDFFFS